MDQSMPAKGIERKRKILFGLLIGFIVLAGLATAFNLQEYLTQGEEFQGAPPYYVMSPFLLAVTFLWLAYRGYMRVASFGLILLLLLPATLLSMQWGAVLPQAILLYPLIITVTGILISARAALGLAGMTGVFLVVVSYLQSAHVLSYDQSWQQEEPGITSVVLIAITIFLTALIAWVYHREIEHSLQRAQTSELALKQERDSLEVKVEERTAELKHAQQEKLLQLRRFVDIGRLASGVMHDLRSPMSVLSLTLSRLIERSPAKTTDSSWREMTDSLKRSQDSLKRMETYVQAANKQIQLAGQHTEFLLDAEIDQAIQLLHAKALTQGVTVEFVHSKSIQYIGDPIKFYQVVTNLLANALDAYPTSIANTRDQQQRLVRITLVANPETIDLKVTDNGSGIDEQDIQQIFNQFFTTKQQAGGLGLGLSLCRDIVEQEFAGQISCDSKKGQGTTFTVQLPILH